MALSPGQGIGFIGVLSKRGEHPGLFKRPGLLQSRAIVRQLAAGSPVRASVRAKRKDVAPSRGLLPRPVARLSAVRVTDQDTIRDLRSAS
jgi:hypothetical protein